MTTAEIIEGVLLSEGPGKPPYLVAGDKGGRTAWGISEKYHPNEWTHGPPSKERARVVLTLEYAQPWEGVVDPALRAQLVDISVLHGRSKALEWLVEGCGLDATKWVVQSEVVKTVNAAYNTLAWDAPKGKVMNNAVVAARLGWIDRYTDQNPSQAGFKNGWMNRALRFLVRT